MQYWRRECHLQFGSNWRGQDGGGKGVIAAASRTASYIEGDTFWSFIRKDGERGLRDNFPVVLAPSISCAAWDDDDESKTWAAPALPGSFVQRPLDAMTAVLPSADSMMGTIF